ncbi:MAG: 50S ribosomal protein L9 [Gemmatimonadota bacterium]
MAKQVDVILRQTMEKLGEEGEIVSVKPGYARNYLLPRGLAYRATESNVRRLEEERQRAEEHARRDYLEARRRASQLEDLSLTFEVRAGEESKLFGSVTAADIAERINEQEIDFEVDRRQLELDEPIKSLGVFPVSIDLGSDVKAEVKVWVIKEE